MGGAYNVYGKDEKSFQNFSLNIWKEETPWET
jgi:hypothetical protein